MAGRPTWGLAIAVALLSGVMTGNVAAEQGQGPVTISQHDYVKACKDLGGTPIRLGTGRVRCDMGGGYYSDCNFKTKICVDHWPSPDDARDGHVRGGTNVVDDPLVVDQRPPRGGGWTDGAPVDIVPVDGGPVEATAVEGAPVQVDIQRSNAGITPLEEE